MPGLVCLLVPQYLSVTGAIGKGNRSKWPIKLICKNWSLTENPRVGESILLLTSFNLFNSKNT